MNNNCDYWETLAKNLQQQLLIDGHAEDCACVTGASIDCTCGRRDFEGKILDRPERCRECGAELVDGDAVDGMCGTCAWAYAWANAG